MDKAKGWCAACERFYPEGEGPANETEFRRFEQRRHQLVEKDFSRLGADGIHGDGLDAGERVELERLNAYADAWRDQFYPDPKTIDALIAEANRFASDQLTEPKE